MLPKPPATTSGTPPPQTMSEDYLKKHKRLVPDYIDPEEQGTGFSDPVGQVGASLGQMSVGNNTNIPPPTFVPATGAPLGAGPVPTTVGQNRPTPSGPIASPDPVVIPAYQSPPTYMRMTTNCMPNTTNLITKAAIPIGCIIHPMAKAVTKEDRIPVVNFGISGLIRCRRCRAYINPFVTFVESGRRWRCNLCNLSNDVPNDYYCPLDGNGRRTDVESRPELSRGIVEFVATAEYTVRPPMPPSYFFVLDVTYSSVTSGLFGTAVQTIKRILDNFPGDSRTRIGFLTFDNTLHFYSLKSTLSNPQMLVVTDLDDSFLPTPTDLLVNLNESKKIINTLLDKLPNMFQATQVVDSTLGVALKAAFNIIQNIGGKIITFASTLPSLGTGKLPNREDLKLLGADKEVSLLVPDDTYYKNFALDCSRQQVSVDLFLATSQFIDVASIGALSQYSGGQTNYYPGFKADRDGEKLYYDIIRAITRETGWESVMRVRTSKGLKVINHFGNFFIRSTDLLALPSVDTDKAFAIQLSLEDSPLTTKYASVQAALLYTTSSGERRIRVLTQCVPVTPNLADIFRLADGDAIATLTTKIAIEKALTSRLSDAREALVNSCIEILAVYRQNLASGGSPSQLLLPESLKNFPLFVLALVKSILLRAGTETRPDERSYYMMLLRTLGVPQTVAFLYPKLYSLHNLPEGVGIPLEDGSIPLPLALNLSSEKLDRRGVLLLEDGQKIFMWIARQVDSTFLQQVFGVPSLEGVDLSQFRLSRFENDLSVRINSIIQGIRNQRYSFQPLQLIREGDMHEAKFLSNYFIEDRSKSVHSYSEFLTNLHTRVQAKIQK